MEALVTQVFTGLSLGSILLLAALGLALTFGQMGVINMAHGEFLMVGAYTAYVVQGFVEDPSTSLFVALPAAFVIAGLLGALLEVVLIRHMYHRPLDTLLVTFGVALLMQQVARDIFGAPNVQVVAPDWLAGGVELLGVTLPAARLFIIALVAVCVAGLSLLVARTSLGRRIRAVVQHRDLAEASGIPTARIDRTTFFIGSGLAGVAGVALTLLGSVGPTLGTNYIVDAFLVVVVGGIGHLRGTVIAAFALGMLQAMVEYSTTASLAKVFVLVAIIIFLQIRPQGIVSVRTRGLA